MEGSDPLPLDPAGHALAELARVLSDRPWEFGEAELARGRAAGLSDAALLHAVVQTAFFNYLNRVADGTGIDFDYESPLPRFAVERGREPLPRPPASEWPRPPERFALAERRPLARQYQAWQSYQLERDAPLGRRERRIAARAAALATCDAAGAAHLDDGEPAGERERAIAATADRLSRAPWRLGGDDLVPLRRLGLDDRALLDLISVASFQNAASRMRLAGVEPGTGP